MSLRSHFDFLFVGRDEGSFLENYSYDLTQEHGEQGGKLFICLEIQNNPADAETIGETMFDVIRKSFFADLEKEPYERLEDALKAANGVVSSFKEQKVSKFIGNIHMIVGVICGNELYLSQTGNAEAYLVRKNYVSLISDGLDADENSDLFMNIANGELEKGDFVIFSTTRLLRYISKTEFVKCISSRNLVASLEKLKDALSTEILSKIGVVGILVSRKEDVIDETSESMQVHEEVLRSSVPPKKRFSGVSFDGFLDSLKKGWASVNGFFGEMKRGDFKFTKDRILLSLIVIILLLTLGVWVMKNKNDQEKQIVMLDTSLQEVAEMLNEAQTKGQFNKKTAGGLLDKAQEKVVEVRNSGFHRSKANELLIQIQAIRTQLDNVTVLKDPQVIADLQTKRDNVSALGILGTGDRLFVYEYNALYELLPNKIEDPVTIDENEKVIAGTDFQDRDSLIFVTKSGKLIEYQDGRFSFSDSQEGEFRKGVAVKDWSNKIYVLDNETKQIWKYPYSGRNESFSAAEGYISEGEISKAVDFAIDRNVFVLQENGEILRFYAGELQNSPIKKLPLDPIEFPTKMYTDKDVPYIFILEPKKNRVLVFNKDETSGGLVYASQYMFEGVDDLRDVYFDLDSRRLYVLSSTKVFMIKF